MPKNALSFHDDFCENVEIYKTDGELLQKGELRFNPNTVASIRPQYRWDKSHIKTWGILHCKYNNSFYTLYNSEVREHLYPKLIVQGKHTNRTFKEITLLFKGASEWLDNTSGFKVQDDGTLKPSDYTPFDVTVNDENRTLRISSKYNIEVQKTEGTTYSFDEYITIRVRAKKGSFNPSEVIEKASEISQVLTILTGYPLSIDYMWLKGSTKYSSSAYLSNSSSTEYPFQYERNCLFHSGYLLHQNKWEGIFKGVYEDHQDRFKKVWPRFVGLYSFVGFWEHEILGYVSLVDRYCDQFVKEDNTISKTKYNKMRFKQKYDYVKSKTDSEIIKIIDITESDFKELKGLRDAIAHGDIPDTKMGSDITYEMTLKSKLKLLLMYWACLDLNLTKNDFINALYQTMHPVKYGASINSTQLNKSSGNVNFIQLSKDSLKKIRKNRLMSIVLSYNSSTKKYKYEEDYTNLLNDYWWLSNKQRQYNSMTDYVASIADKTKFKDSLYIGNVQIFNANDHELIGNVVILNAPNNLKGAWQKRVIVHG